jgi:hypothetical protein
MTLARALRTFDFLARRHHDALVARLAILAIIFVDRHFLSLQTNRRLQQIEELLHADLGLAQNTSQNGLGQVEPVVARYSHPKMRFAGVTQLGMAPRLMMNHKSGAQKRAQHFSGLQNRKVRRHLGRESYSQPAFVRKPFVRNGLSRFPQPFDMAFDCISCHLLGLCQGTAIRHEPWQDRDCHLKSSFGLRIFTGRGAPLRSIPVSHVASITLIYRQVNHGKSEILRFQFLSLCPIDANLARHDVSLALW